jgi:hypothetical protein
MCRGNSEGRGEATVISPASHGRAAAGGRRAPATGEPGGVTSAYARMSFTTSPWTSVRRKSLPWNR